MRLRDETGAKQREGGMQFRLRKTQSSALNLTFLERQAGLLKGHLETNACVVDLVSINIA